MVGCSQCECDATLNHRMQPMRMTKTTLNAVISLPNRTVIHPSINNLVYYAVTALQLEWRCGNCFELRNRESLRQFTCIEHAWRINQPTLLTSPDDAPIPNEHSPVFSFAVCYFNSSISMVINFRWAANSINVFILSHVRVTISR